MFWTKKCSNCSKKKVTAHWRKFISPLMWRCQWLELRIKEIQNQALRYDKELAMLKHEKALHAKIIELDNSCSRVVPLSSRCRNKKAMKRRKRKKEEETVDGVSYISDHIIFSYYGTFFFQGLISICFFKVFAYITYK
jgi:hypothetical protein